MATTPQAPQDKHTYVEDIRGGIVREYFMLSKKEQRLTQTHKPYLVLAFIDRTGEIEARWWDAEMDSTDAEPGDIVKVEATAEEYPPGRGTYQLKVSRIFKPTAGKHFIPDLAHFLKASKQDPRLMHDAVCMIVWENAVGSPDIVRLLLAVLNDEIVLPLLMEAPAAMSYHHAYIGGLLEHMLSLMRGAVALREHYVFDLPIVLAACVLHDIGKCWELDRERGAISYSKLGVLHGHIAIGFSLVDRMCDQLEIDTDVQAHILHLIASHHGSKEHGSPVTPATREAVVFHALDKLDATLAAIDAAEELPSDESALFTPYIPSLRSRFLRAKPSTQPVVQDGNNDPQGETHGDEHLGSPGAQQPS